VKVEMPKIEDVLERIALARGRIYSPAPPQPRTWRDDYPGFDDARDIPCERLELSVRSARILRELGLITVADLLQKSERDLFCVLGCGRTTVNEIQDMLRRLGVGTLRTLQQDRAQARRDAAEAIAKAPKPERLRIIKPYGEKPERNERIYNDFKNGKRRCDLAREHGISPTMVAHICRRAEKRLKRMGGGDWLAP